jgi:hypothetical protein
MGVFPTTKVDFESTLQQAGGMGLPLKRAKNDHNRQRMRKLLAKYVKFNQYRATSRSRLLQSSYAKNAPFGTTAPTPGIADCSADKGRHSKGSRDSELLRTRHEIEHSFDANGQRAKARFAKAQLREANRASAASECMIEQEKWEARGTTGVAPIHRESKTMKPYPLGRYLRANPASNENRTAA